MTFIAALRHDRLEAPWLLDCPINGDRCLAYVANVLVPTLRRGDVVSADNLQSHKRHAVRAAIRRVGARLLFLPKYSPGLNPIEQLFAKLKHLLRKAAARTQAPSARLSARSSTASPPKSAPTTSPTQVMLPPNVISL
jgi:transposase